MIRNTILFVLCVTLQGGLVRAENPGTNWMKYLEGRWTYEISDGTKGDAVWTFEADGQSMIGRFKEGEGTGVEIGGWQPDTEIVMVNGYGSKGDYWQLEYKKFSKKGGRGSIRGKIDNVDYSGDFEGTIVNKDQWGWTIKGKTSAGEALDLSATFNRVKPKPQPTNADRLKAFEFFIGKWKAEESDGGVTKWEFDWGRNKNSIENNVVVKNGEGMVTLSHSGAIVWDGGNRRFVNALVSGGGNRIDFLWNKNGEKEWQTWRRGGNATTAVTIIDENTWSMTWDGGSSTYKRQD